MILDATGPAWLIMMMALPMLLLIGVLAFLASCASLSHGRRRRRRSAEQLEPRAMLSAPDWRELPVSALPVAQGAVQDTAAFDLVGSAAQRAQFGLTGAGYSVAIIDTGLDYHNPAFAGRYLGGWDFVNDDPDPMDDNGHGTHVAGIVASADASYPGVAPGVGIVALKVLNANGSGSFGNVEAALQWVGAHQAQYHIAAVNMSLGTGDYAANPYTFLDADLTRLRQEGVFVAAAAGNDYFASGSQPGLAFPAIDPLVVSVGAVWAADYGAVAWSDGARDSQTGPDRIVSFSQRSSELDLLAPGAFVTSTYLGDSYASMAGTSMATPMIAASAVLVHEALVDRLEPADPDAVLKVLRSTGVEITDAETGADNVQHTGLPFPRIDLVAAVGSVSGPQTPNERYVATLYQNILGRHADPGGLSYWAARLDAGFPRLQAAAAVWNSAEHLGQEVQADYVSILGRRAGEEEIAYWVARMQAGLHNADVQQAFYASDEFYRKSIGQT